MAKADYENLCVEYARAVQSDLSGLLGTEVRLKGPKIAIVSAAEAAQDPDPVTHTVCEAEDGSGGRIHLVVPVADAVGLAGLIMAFDAEEIEARRKAGLDDDLRDAFGEVMNMAAAILSRIGEAMELPALSRGDTHDALDAEALGGSRLRRARWRLVVPDQPEGRMEMWIPEEALSEWFGEALGEGGPRDPEPDADGGGTLVIVDPGETDRETVEAMEAELGVAIWALEPGQLGAESFEELADASAVILEWDLGSCTGLDVLHALQGEERTAHLPVALASARPTRRMVLSGLRSGARTFLMKPYEIGEIRTRLGLGTAGAAQHDASDPDAAPAGEAAGGDDA